MGVELVIFDNPCFRTGGLFKADRRKEGLSNCFEDVVRCVETWDEPNILCSHQSDRVGDNPNPCFSFFFVDPEYLVSLFV